MPAKKSDAAIPEDIAKLSFEEAMGELETIVSSLEDGNVDLEKSTNSAHREISSRQISSNAKYIEQTMRKCNTARNNSW